MTIERWHEIGGPIHAGRGDGADYTLCGYAPEGECSDYGGDKPCVRVTRDKINCPDCISMIRHAKTIPARFLSTPDALKGDAK